MEKDWETLEIHGRVCHVYKNCGKSRRMPVFYWGIDRESEALARQTVSYLEKKKRDAFIIAAYECVNWNDDFSPWKAPPVFGDACFGGKADKTLEWLTKEYIPYIESADSAYITNAETVYRFTAGYSLAGLFSLWAYGSSRRFDGAVSCSGSLWYPGWLDYVQANRVLFCKKASDCIYLSLGDKEEWTKNRLMSAVGDNTRKIFQMLCEDPEGVRGVLEWNAGGHFSEPDIRIAKGIDWILQHVAV